MTMTAFDRLVVHGCKHRWCWKLGCTTCGSMDFRNGMELIGMGRDPVENPDMLHQCRLLWRDETDDYAARTLPLGCQVAAADVGLYFQEHTGIDWLGFMGLALARIEDLPVLNCPARYDNRLHAENQELLMKLISNSWSRKFFSLFQSHPPRQPGAAHAQGIDGAMSECKKIMLGERGRFGIADLEIMEGGIIELNQYRSAQSSQSQPSNAIIT